MSIRPADHGVFGSAGGAAIVGLSGGTAFTVGADNYMKFTASGTLTVTGSGRVDYLIVAAGAGGGYNLTASSGSGGGGGGGGLTWGTNYELNASVKSTFTIVIGGGGSGGNSSSSPKVGSSGSSCQITDFGLANGTSNFDFAGGSSYATTGDDSGSAGGGGGGEGGFRFGNQCVDGATGVMANTFLSSGDWGSGGGGGGGGGRDGVAGGNGGYGGNSVINTTSADEGIDTITSQNSDGTIATHYVAGRNTRATNGGTLGMAGQPIVVGSVSSPSQVSSPSYTGSLTSVNRAWLWSDNGRYGAPGAGGQGDWYDANDGGGRGGNHGGPIDAAVNQGGGGAGGYGSNGGNGGSGIILFKILVG